MSSIANQIINSNNSKEYLAYQKYHEGNIFGITKTSRLEHMHSNFIAWLLDPSSNHALGMFSIIRLLQLISLSNKHDEGKTVLSSEIYNQVVDGSILINRVQIFREYVFYEGEKKRSKRSIDILIEVEISDKILPIIIENKVNITEHDDQTWAYYNWAEMHYKDTGKYFPAIYIFLTPAYNNKPCKCLQYISIKYQELVDFVIEPCMWASENPSAVENIKMYLQCLSYQADNSKGENTMAISSEERELLQSYFDKNKNLVLALMEILTDDDIDKSDKDKIMEMAREKDFTKYDFCGSKYGKGKLVLAVLKKYVDDNPTVNFADLLTSFPKGLQGSSGVIKESLSPNEKKYKRFYIDEPISLKDGTNVFVCSQWGAANIQKFIDQATKLGYSISPV